MPLPSDNESALNVTSFQQSTSVQSCRVLVSNVGKFALLWPGNRGAAACWSSVSVLWCAGNVKVAGCRITRSVRHNMVNIRSAQDRSFVECMIKQPDGWQDV
eukprot:935620-Amphidinium_carterae.2